MKIGYNNKNRKLDQPCGIKAVDHPDWKLLLKPVQIKGSLEGKD